MRKKLTLRPRVRRETARSGQGVGERALFAYVDRWTKTRVGLLVSPACKVMGFFRSLPILFRFFRLTPHCTSLPARINIGGDVPCWQKGRPSNTEKFRDESSSPRAPARAEHGARDTPGQASSEDRKGETSDGRGQGIGSISHAEYWTRVSCQAPPARDDLSLLRTRAFAGKTFTLSLIHI